jgi:hypothetical protein
LAYSLPAELHRESSIEEEEVSCGGGIHYFCTQMRLRVISIDSSKLIQMLVSFCIDKGMKRMQQMYRW